MHENTNGQRIIECQQPPIGVNIKSGAMRVLTGNELKLFIYFLDIMETEEEKTVFPLRWEEISYYTGMGRNSCFNAINGLIKKGFLIQNKQKKYIFLFDGTRHE